MALLTFIKPLTGIGGHGFQLDVSAIRARQDRLQNHSTHLVVVINIDG